jgi:hypothetical protein
MKMQLGLCEVGAEFLNVRRTSVSKGVGSCDVDQQIQINQSFLPLKTTKPSRPQYDFYCSNCETLNHMT